LDRRPERWAFMQEQFRRLGMPTRRWPAVDGRDLDLADLVASGDLRQEALSRLFMPDDAKVFGLDLTPGAIGCAMSHIQVWIDIMQRRGNDEFDGTDREQVFLVVEDDCEFLPGFSEEGFRARLAEVPEDWELVFLGGVDAIGVQDLLQISPGIRRVYNGSRETTGYIINVQGVRSALEVCTPLMWQLDTQLTMSGRTCEWNPDIMYTTKPMSYIFWPPLVEQDKEAFPTDVQKDQHPRFLHGPDGDTRYDIVLEPTDMFGPPATALERSLPPLGGRFALVGSWDDWRHFYDFRLASAGEDDGGGGALGAGVGMLEAEVDIPPAGALVEFQMVRDNDWNQRVFPSERGEMLVGSSDVAHGHNWKLEVPPEGSLLQMRWDPAGAAPITWRFFEPLELSLSRTYSLIGSWNGWSDATPMDPCAEDGFWTFLGALELEAGAEVLFQVICDGDPSQRLFPSATGGEVLGPSEEGEGEVAKHWKVVGRATRTLLQVRLDPVGKRKLDCTLTEL